MNLPRLQPAKPGLLLLAPMLGVMLLLAFYLFYGRSFQIQPGIAVVPPPSPFVVAPTLGASVVSIVSGDSPRLYFRDRVVTMEEFDRSLQALPESAKRTLIVRADRGASFETVLAVANKAIERHYAVIFATNPPIPTSP